MSPGLRQVGAPRVRGRAAVALASIVLGVAFAAIAAVQGPAVQGELPPPGPAAIVAMIDAGDFKQADTAIDAALAAPGITDSDRDALLFQRERMRRIRLDFNKSEADVRKQLRDNIPDLRDDEFAGWERSNQLEHMTIDGEKRYFSRAASNLYRLSPEAVARRKSPPKFTDSPLEAAHPHHAQARAAALASGKGSVLPQRFRITQSLTVEADAVPAGETVRAWVP